VRQLTNAVQSVIAAKDGNVFGISEVFLDGRRSEVRTEETNLGNLSADANLFVARQFDPGVSVSLKNGGGIRAEIGALLGQPVPSELPPLANPAVGKPNGGISQLDIENSLRFNNALTKLAVTAENLERLFEHAVAAVAPGATPGQFAQIGGVSFSFDATKTAQVVNGTTGIVSTVGQRVQNLVILNEDGSIADTIVSGGVLQGDPARQIKLVTLSFLADGGDGYPLVPYTVPGSRVDLLNNTALAAGNATFAARGSEQDALAEYVKAVHGTAATAYDVLDVAASGDLRIQNLAFRQDTSLIEYAQVFRDGLPRLQQLDRYTGPVSYLQFETRGSDAGEVMNLRATNDFVNLRGGDDAANGGAGNDVLDGGTGSNFLTGGSGADVFFLDIRNPGGSPTWSTITDFTAEDELSIFGWNPAASRSFWVASDGAEGFKGATMHIDIDGDRDIDASVTFTGVTQAQAGVPVQFDGLLWFV
jgi:Ca2+-binding RTX toxin-like protein